ncbi:hypothetical protein Q9233_017748 [Columba guinea]|nr:hypothetical protein Q9233_017748 [Columba guinea]
MGGKWHGLGNGQEMGGKWARGWGTGKHVSRFPDLVDVSSVKPEFPVSDPTVFQKRYLKKIRELGEVSDQLGLNPPIETRTPTLRPNPPH